MTRATEELAFARGYLAGLTQNLTARELAVPRAQARVRELSGVVAEETRAYRSRVLTAQQSARDAKKIREQAHRS